MNLHPNVVLVLSVLHKLATDLRASWAARLQESHDQISHLYDSVGLPITIVAKKNHLVELLRRTGVPLFVDSYCSITERKFAGSPEKTIMQHLFF